MDTLVDPVETLSSAHLRAAAAAPPAAPPRPTMQSVDPDAQVQWFSRVLEEPPPPAIDIEIAWDEENDTSPTLVLRRPAC